MGVTIKFNPAMLEAQIQQIGERAMKHMSLKMRKRAIKIRDLARDNAPTKTGLLEDSIEFEHIKVGRRDAFVVFIKRDASRRGDRSGTLDEYVDIMEEELHPHGRQKGKLRFTVRDGSASADKAATGKKVGGRFLRRAFREATKGIENEMNAAVREVLGKGPSLRPASSYQSGGDDQ